jgi:hypothetical protein
MAAALLTFTALTLGGVFSATDPLEGAYLMLVTTMVTTVVWVVVTFVTAPTPEATLDTFYRRVRPGGRGWAHVAARLGYGSEPIAGGALSWVNWIAGVVSVYATLFGVGKLIFGPRVQALLYFLVAAVAFAWIARSFRNETPAGSTVRAGSEPVAAR